LCKVLHASDLCNIGWGHGCYDVLNAVAAYFF
jgi:hypothetical protein